jgi:hypothetical protein
LSLKTGNVLLNAQPPLPIISSQFKAYKSSMVCDSRRRDFGIDIEYQKYNAWATSISKGKEIQKKPVIRDESNSIKIPEPVPSPTPISPMEKKTRIQDWSDYRN